MTWEHAIQHVLCHDVNYIMQQHNSWIFKKPRVFKKQDRKAIASLIEKKMLESSVLAKSLFFCLKHEQ